MDYGIFNVHTDVNTCDCTRGCADTVIESALKVDSGKKTTPLPHREIEPVSAKCRSDALPTDLHPHLQTWLAWSLACFGLILTVGQSEGFVDGRLSGLVEARSALQGGSSLLVKVVHLHVTRRKRFDLGFVVRQRV